LQSNAVPTTVILPYFRRTFKVLQANHLPYYFRMIKAQMNCWTSIWLLLFL